MLGERKNLSAQDFLGMQKKEKKKKSVFAILDQDITQHLKSAQGLLRSLKSHYI